MATLLFLLLVHLNLLCVGYSAILFKDFGESADFEHCLVRCSHFGLKNLCKLRDHLENYIGVLIISLSEGKNDAALILGLRVDRIDFLCLRADFLLDPLVELGQPLEQELGLALFLLLDFGLF